VTNLTELGFIHKFVEPKEGADTVLFLLHGTGGTENDLIPLGRDINKSAAILSPRGKILENGAPRFFRRLAEGVFDLDDLKFRTGELSDFIEKASDFYKFGLQSVVAIGYSNGANMAASLLLLRPKVICAAILFRPMVPLVPEILPDLSTKNIFVSGGLYDPIVPKVETERLVVLFKKCGANIFVNWENSGHELRTEEITVARNWLSNLLK
jgi:phospholipase/carboxylesterase